MGDTHRVAIAPELFHEARRYMVEHDLPTVRSAVEAMIEAQSCKEPGAPVIANKTQEVEHCENGEAAKTKEGLGAPVANRVLSHQSQKMGVTSPTELPTKEGKDEKE